jgi:3-keto steroid reductase
MVYAALVEDQFIQKPEVVPAQKFSVVSQRWGDTKVKYGEVDSWEDTEALRTEVVQACETVRSDWSRREHRG